MDPVALFVGLLFLLVASWHDLRTREVPDLISYGLIIFGISYGIAKTLLLGSWIVLLQMLFGLLVGAALGLAMFYLGQWGGADSKLIIGLGALLGLGYGDYDILLYILLALFSGAVYGCGYTAWLALRHKKLFIAEFKSMIREPRIHRMRAVVVAGCFVLFLAAIFIETLRPLLITATIAVYLLFYVWLCVKVVEQSILIKEYPVGKLTEGDWIYKDVVIRGKRICGPKDLGISNEQIAALKKLNAKKVWVKEGIPFVPSFLIALLLLWLFSSHLKVLFANFV